MKSRTLDSARYFPRKGWALLGMTSGRAADDCLEVSYSGHGLVTSPLSFFTTPRNKEEHERNQVEEETEPKPYLFAPSYFSRK